MNTSEQWHVDPHLPVLVVDSAGNCVASSFIGVPGDAEALAKAEARACLLAQAPAMAEALRDCEQAMFTLIGSHGLNPSENETLAAARAILAKLESKK